MNSVYKSTCHLFKSIIISSPFYKAESISKRIAKLFNLKLINCLELEKKQICAVHDITPLILQELDKNACRSWLLDGYPRTRNEAEILWKQQKCHIALNLKIPMDVIISQASKERYIHAESGREYSTEFNPPVRKYIDDLTGDELIRGKDYTAEEIKLKIMENEEDFREIVNFYRERGILQEIHGYSTTDLINKSRICLSSVLPDSLL